MMSIFFLVRRLERLRGFDAAKAKKRAGALRVFGLSCATAFAVGTCAMGSAARAEVREATVTVGEEMSDLADLLQEPHLLSINGEQMWASSGVTDDDVHHTLDRFEAHCRAREGITGEMWRQITATKDPHAPLPEGSPLNVMRREDEGHHAGVVVCLVKPTNRETKTLSASIADFAQTHDLGALGAVRYAYVHAAQGGRTSVITAWTENKFLFDNVFPKDGAEPPGSDSPNAPRPPGSTHRILCAAVAGSPFGVRVYQSSATPGDVYAAYDQTMTARGWTKLVAPAGTPTGDDGRGYLKDGYLLAIAATADPNGGSVVSVGDLAGSTTDSAVPHPTTP